MALEHAHSGEVIDIQPLGSLLAGARTAVLVKTNAIEVLRLIVPPGKEIHSHKVAGEATVQCLEGRVAFTVDGIPRDLAAGQLLFLHGGQVHGIRGLEGSSLLVTICLHP
jgi:quercetin dioxygenase-like cupin family protein